MAGPIQEKIIRSWGCVSSAKDSTESDPKVNSARNIRNRPIGCITGAPRYFRLWGLGNSQTMRATFAALTYTPPGGSPRAINTSTDKTIAVRVYKDGFNFLILYSFGTSKCRGMFYMGNDGTFNGTPNFSAGSASMEVLAVQLDDNARWYGPAYYGALFLGNGVDPNAVVQLGRTVAPGKWRTAGSNAQPTAAVIRQVAPSGATNVQASWTIPGTQQAVFDAVLPRNCTVDVAGLFTVSDRSTPHGLQVNDVVLIDVRASGGVQPSGFTAGTLYYVVTAGLNAIQFKLSATQGGAAITSTSSSTTITFQLLSSVSSPTHTFANGDTVDLSTTILLPGVFSGTALDTSTTYYVVRARAGTLGLSLTLGGSPILVSSPGFGVSTMVDATPTSGSRTGPAALTFTANLQNFPGTQGENIYVSISYNVAGYETAISSILAGNGTVSDPYHYLIYTGPGFSSTDAIVAFVNGDTNAVGILAASQDVVDNNEDVQSWALHQLDGGVDGGSSGGFSNQTCSVITRYWDPGNAQLGYEGISSIKSNEIIIDALSNYDIEVAIPTSPTAEGGRFGFIRVYFQFGEDAFAQWNLVGEVANTTGTKTLTVGVSTPIGQVMEVDQNRVLPSTLAVFSGGNVWHGGVTSFPTRLYPSKQANETEVFPEGANSQAYEIVRFAEGATAQRISALYSDDYKLHVHSPQGVVLIVPSDPDNRYMPNVTAGAATSSALAVWVKGRLQYLGADLQLYEIQGTRYGRQSSDFLALDAAQYVRDLVDRNQFAAHADRCFMFTDVPGQFLWYWIPGTDGSLVGFAYDQILKGTVGPFDFPKVYQLAKLEIERPEYVFADEAGNLFCWNTAEQYDHGDDLGTSATPTVHTAGSGASTPSEAGFGQVAVTGGEYWRSVTSVLETGYLDLGRPGQMKTFLGALITSVKGSRGLLSVTFTAKNGLSQSISYGDVYSKGIRNMHKVLANLGDTAVKVGVTMVSAEMDPWMFRDLTLQFRSLGQL